MDSVLLFRKHSPFTNYRVHWARNSDEHFWNDQHSASSKGVVSASLVWVLLRGLEGRVL